MEDPRVIAVAHRGASAYAPENTIAAFDEAIRLGATAVEFDLHITSDGVPVVIHDPTLDRTTNGKGRVDQTSRFDLLRLDAGSWFHPRFAGTRIPTLEEALIAIGPSATPVIELKTFIDPALLTSILKRHQLLEESLVISFDIASLRALRMHTADVPLGLLAENWTPDLIPSALGIGASHLVIAAHMLLPQTVAQVQNEGLEVWTYTANDVGLVAACAALGASGIITDKPDLIRRK
jgi:glycerophosphoryl diester phosphodiesterase